MLHTYNKLYTLISLHNNLIVENKMLSDMLSITFIIFGNYFPIKAHPVSLFIPYLKSKKEKTKAAGQAWSNTISRSLFV